MVKVVDSHLCGRGSIPGRSCSFFIVSLSKDLSLYFMYSDQHVKYRMSRGFPLTRSLLLDYQIKQYIHTLVIMIMMLWSSRNGRLEVSRSLVPTTSGIVDVILEADAKCLRAESTRQH